MDKAFKKFRFINKKKPALNETNLNAIIDAIDTIDDRVIDSDENKLSTDGDSKDNTVSFTQEAIRENIASGDSHATLFGKISKWLADLKTVAFTGSYIDLINKPPIGNGILTIQKNGTNVKTFTANQTADAIANIEVPTKLSELDDDDDRYLRTSGKNAMQGNLNMNGHHIKSENKDVDFGDDTLEIGMRDHVTGEWISLVRFGSGTIDLESELNIEITGGKAKIDVGSEMVKIESHTSTSIDAGNDLHINTGSGIDMNSGNSQTSFTAPEFCFYIKDHGRIFRATNSGLVEITPFKGLKVTDSNGEKIKLRSASEILLVPGMDEDNNDKPTSKAAIRTGDLKGINLATGEKPSISNFKNINVETVNGKNVLYENDIKDDRNQLNSYILADYTSVGREITDSWAEIKANVNAGNISKYKVGDYKKFVITGYTFIARIAGINTYSGRKQQSGYLGCHIDFITDELSFEIQMNTVNTNNGNTNPGGYVAPYLSTNAYEYLNTVILEHSIPQDIKNIISNKQICMETRYSDSGTLTSSNGISSIPYNLGKLWLPTEYEVFGCEICGTKAFSSGQGYQVQYPLFKYWPRFIQKRDVASINPLAWWLWTPADGSSTQWLGVDRQGCIFYGQATDKKRMPICFRIQSDIYN